MLRLIFKFIGSVVGSILLVLHIKGLNEIDYKVWGTLVALVALSLATIADIIGGMKSSREDKISKLRKSKREMENILTDFKQNGIKAFVYLGIIDEQSEGDPISYERIYEWSQDGNLIKLLREHEYNYMYIVHALEDFAGLYESTDLKEIKK